MDSHRFSESINKAISEKRIEDAKSLYEKLLTDLSYSYSIYNLKLTEYVEFLKENFDYGVVKKNIETEVERAAKRVFPKYEDRYSLYMFAGNVERECGDRKGAFECFLKAKEIKEM